CARSVSFTATAPPALSTLSLHDALPILNNGHVMQGVLPAAVFLCHLVVAFQHGMVGVQKRLLQGSCIGSVALKVVPQRQQNVGGVPGTEHSLNVGLIAQSIQRAVDAQGQQKRGKIALGVGGPDAVQLGGGVVVALGDHAVNGVLRRLGGGSVQGGQCGG